MTAPVSAEALDHLFGVGDRSDSIETRALRSSEVFVRGQTMLAKAAPAAQGRQLTAHEALKTYGLDVLLKVADQGQAALVPDRTEPAATIRAQREQLGLTVEKLARMADCRPAEIHTAETPGKVSSIRLLERLAPKLALDERYLGFDKTRSADASLGVRFRTLAGDDTQQTRLSGTTVMQLAEAAWVIARQQWLAAEIGETSAVRGRFKPNMSYAYPAYAVGFRLADQTRQLLELQRGEPVNNLRRLIEDVLGIPLVETELGQALAGATIANGAHRGIVVNTQGRNENVWVRRMTLAHELGHLLWDPVQKLMSLMVDRYDEIEGDVARPRDPVEIRANAFAVSFLAPPADVDRIVRARADIWDAIVEISETFGISPTASRMHVGNVCQVRAPTLGSRSLPTPSYEWKAQEDYVNDFFPLKTTPLSRRGRFAWFVLRALEASHISLDSAATWLGATPSELMAQREQLVEITRP